MTDYLTIDIMINDIDCVVSTSKPRCIGFFDVSIKLESINSNKIALKWNLSINNCHKHMCTQETVYCHVSHFYIYIGLSAFFRLILFFFSCKKNSNRKKLKYNNILEEYSF